MPKRTRSPEAPVGPDGRSGMVWQRHAASNLTPHLRWLKAAPGLLPDTGDDLLKNPPTAAGIASTEAVNIFRQHHHCTVRFSRQRRQPLFASPAIAVRLPCSRLAIARATWNGSTPSGRRIGCPHSWRRCSWLTRRRRRLRGADDVPSHGPAAAWHSSAKASSSGAYFRHRGSRLVASAS